jgi:twitching motility protein PilT
MPDYVPDPEISDLVRQLNRAARPAPRREPGPQGDGPILERLLAWAAGRGASDLLLVSGSEPAARIGGEIVLVDGAQLTADEIGAIFRELLDPVALKRLGQSRSFDLGFERPGVGRLRANLHFERGAPALTVRLLPAIIPSLEELQLPEVVTRLTALRRGLVLITGPAGSGKSTTLAALVTCLLQARACHVVTLEDPIEYVLAHGRGLVEQIEIGRDAPSFAAALRAALRQAPEIILVGEMRDAETIALALTAAETGHLVLSTLHTGDTSQAIDRVLDVFGSGHQDQIRAQLALALQAIVAQVLLPVPDRAGARRAVCEVLIANDAVRKRIRRGETQHLHQEITLGKASGMVTLEEALARHVREGLAARAEAAAWARHPEEFAKHLDGR